ncbi:MAG: hypothetical protein JST67_04795 [Bacteroidetes bacterium]|nr:hypothetical protein [Bacteroidota bacterium]
MSRFFTTALLGICFMAQSQNKKHTSVLKEKQQDTTYVILPYSAAPWVFKEAKPSALTKKDVLEIDHLLKESVKEYQAKHPSAQENERVDLKKYQRQYIAVINNKGEKEVWVNCFCYNMGVDFYTQVLDIKDGGSCFFNVKINLTQKKHYQFTVNSNG